MRVSTTVGTTLTFDAAFSTTGWSGECRLTFGNSFRAFRFCLPSRSTR